MQMETTKRHCYELQQQLQEQRELHDKEGSDMARMNHKVHSLEYDLGSLRQSLQVGLSSVHCLVNHVAAYTTLGRSCCRRCQPA